MLSRVVKFIAIADAAGVDPVELMPLAQEIWGLGLCQRPRRRRRRVTESPRRKSEAILHTCPAEGCQQEVRDDRLMCWSHWKLVPKELQDAVYEAWNNGRGAGTEEHQLACRAAIVEAGKRSSGRRP